MSRNPGSEDEASFEQPARELVEKLKPVLRPERKQEAERVIGMMMQKFHQGPLPAPEDLAHYEQICPGSAERIIAMAERNQIHRHELEAESLKCEYRLQSRGQWLAISALAAMLLLIGFTFWLGQPIAGSILGGGVLVAIVGMFLTRGRSADEDQDRRRSGPDQKQRQAPSKRRKQVG